MNLKRVAGGLGRSGFWAGTGYVVFKTGAGVKEFGKEIMKIRDPLFGLPIMLIGASLVGAGEVMQIGAVIVNGTCTFSAGLDVIGGLKEKVDEEEV